MNRHTSKLSTALLLATMGCESNAGLAGQAVEQAGSAAPAALEACGKIAFDDMATLCRIDVASRAGAAADPEMAARACEIIPEGMWRDQCYFTVAEELVASRDPLAAVGSCGGAGRYRGQCVGYVCTHYPFEPDADMLATPSGVADAVSERLQAIDARLREHGFDDDMSELASECFAHRLWLDFYLGSGVADPTHAQSAQDDALVPARTAFVLEAVRLLLQADISKPYGLIEAVEQTWSGQRPALTGTTKAFEAGQLGPPLPLHAPPNGPPTTHYVAPGSRRYLAPTVEEDLGILVLYAGITLPQRPKNWYERFADDPRPVFRQTAEHLSLRR